MLFFVVGSDCAENKKKKPNQRELLNKSVEPALIVQMKGP